MRHGQPERLTGKWEDKYSGKGDICSVLKRVKPLTRPQVVRG